MFTRPSQRQAIPLEAYLNALYKIKGTKKAFDALAVHPYARKPAEALRTVRRVRTLTRKHHDASTPIWVTELGWASSGTRSRYTTSPEGQAANLQASFEQPPGERGEARHRRCPLVLGWSTGQRRTPTG